MAAMMSMSPPPEGTYSFAERLRRIGVEIEWEVRQSVESAVQNAQRETRHLRDEVDWLQRQLDDERQQSAARLGLCAELKRQLEEMQEAHHQEVEARNYWQRECTVFEERHSILEAKLAAMALAEIDSRAAGGDASKKPPENHTRKPAASSRGVHGSRSSSGDTDDLPTCGRSSSSKQTCNTVTLDPDDASSVEQYLDYLEKHDDDVQLHKLKSDGIHTLLVAAASRRDGAGALIHRIARSWILRLFSRNGGNVVRAAVTSGSAEGLSVLLELAGTKALTAAADSDVALSSTCLIDLCLEHDDIALLELLLQYMHGSESGLESARCAHRNAILVGQDAVASTLARHLVLELSLFGNAKYQKREFEDAISHYVEAIHLCEETLASAGASNPLTGMRVETTCESSECGAHTRASARESLIKLRYNLARALNRSDRWAEAREQATAVLSLDNNYINAYALRAQAAMAAADWAHAEADWDRLIIAISAVSAPGCPALAAGADVVAAWRKRREECARQLALGHYEVLDLPRLSSLEEVKRAYHDMARRWHPDKHPDHQDKAARAARCFSRIREAYEVLSDESSKHAYDSMLLLREARPLTPGRRESSTSMNGAEVRSAGNVRERPHKDSAFGQKLR